MKPPETSVFRKEANLFRACAAFVLLSILMTTTAAVAAEENAPATNTPLALHPENPRYFLFRDQPAILVTSGEHYGALLNGEFDFETYFATLAADGFNLTRIFSGAYCEQIGAFKIERNTLAPAEGQLVAPWLRSDTPGYANGGNKFDLSQWNPDYFERLEALMKSASRHGIAVEFVFFCPFYRDDMWALSPLHPANHIDPLSAPSKGNDIWSLDRSGDFLGVQEKLVRKIVTALNGYDNLYYEICNEPYQRDLPMDWHDHIAELIVATEKNLPHRHLVSWNVANHGDGEKALVREPHPAYSIFNFHYSNPPDEVANNWHLKKPIGDNETGFDGQENRPYRTEAWEFLLAGGALFNHLDYSFAAGGHEDGSFSYPEKQPGGGNATLRKQFAALKRLIEEFDIPKLAPVKVEELIVEGIPKGARARVLAESTGDGWLIYLSDCGGQDELRLSLKVPTIGVYLISWIDLDTGESFDQEQRLHGGKTPMVIDGYGTGEDLAIKLTRQDPLLPRAAIAKPD
jgi:hypothetical protein